MAKSDNKSLNIKPSRGYLLIKPDEQATQTASGIYLPDSAKGDKPQQGVVVAVGDDDMTDSGKNITAPASKNAIVIYKKWGGNEVKVESVEYLFVKFEDILGVIG